MKLLLYYEKMKHDPADPSEYRLINAQAVVTKAHRYIETGDVTVLMVPLENGALELFCRAQQLQAVSALALVQQQQQQQQHQQQQQLLDLGAWAPATC